MTTIDLTPLYRSSVGYDRLGSLIDSAFRADHGAGYPPYNIEVLDENHYAITVAVAGFSEDELDIKVENGLLSIRGQKGNEDRQRKFLHQGIANRTFERKFNLAEFVEVTDASLDSGLLTVSLVREIPEAMKPKSIAIKRAAVLEHGTKSELQSAEVA